MNAFNALFVSLVGLALVAAGIFMLLIVTGILAATAVPFSAFDAQASAMAAKKGASVLVDIGIASGLILVGVILLGLELKKLAGAATPGMLLLESSATGSVRMALDSIRELAEMAGMGNREVRQISCAVKVVKGGLRLRCAVALRMGSDVSSVSRHVQQNVLETVERLTGVQVIEVPIRARYLRDRDQAVLVR